MAELEEIVENRENGSIDLEKSIEFYTRGSHLKAHCQQKLNDAVLKLEEIKVSSDGKVSKKEIGTENKLFWLWIIFTEQKSVIFEKCATVSLAFLIGLTEHW